MAVPTSPSRPWHAGANCENITAGTFWLETTGATVNNTIVTVDECCSSCNQDAQCVRFMLVPGESGSPTICYVWDFLAEAPITGSPLITIGYGEAGFLTCVRARVRGGWGAAPGKMGSTAGLSLGGEWAPRLMTGCWAMLQ